MFVLGITLTFSYSTLSAQVYTDLHDLNNVDGSVDCGVSPLIQGRDGNLYGTLCSGGTNGKGVVFKITPTGSYSVLYNFDDIHGSLPKGITLGSDGKFYGTTLLGGLHNLGTFYKITSSGTLTVLHDFTGVLPDGGNPFAPPIQGVDGNFYGTDQNYLGTQYYVYQATPTGDIHVIGRAPGYSLSSLTERPGFGFYGTTPAAGAFGEGTIFHVAETSTVVFNFDQTHGRTPEGGLVLGDDGNFYGTAPYGGEDLGQGSGGVLFRVSPGGAMKVMHSFVGPADRGTTPSAGLAQASNGSFYGVTVIGGTGEGVAFVFTPKRAYSQPYFFDGTHGGHPFQTPVQHSNGRIYGVAAGGAHNAGAIYSIDYGLPSGVRLVRAGGQVGQTIGVLGQGFTRTTKVQFANDAAQFTVVSDRFLTAIVPPTIAAPRVVVSTPSGILESNQKFILQPVISSFSPESGPPGTQVTIIGSGLRGVADITFRNIKASFVLDSDSQITATVPLNARTGRIRATTIAAKGTSAGMFQVVP